MSDLTPEEYQAEVRKLRHELTELRAGRGLHVAPESPPLRQREILRALLTERVARAASTNRATARLTRNAKGETQIEVLCEVTDPDATAAVNEAVARVNHAYEALGMLYPAGSLVSPTTAGGSDNG